MSILQVNDLQKVYTTRFGGVRVPALTGVTFSVEPSEYVAIMGESGAGKTTLLNLLAALDKPTAGQILLDGKDLSAVPEARLAAFRRENLGFVFQDFNLLDNFTLEDNIYLPLVLSRVPYEEMHRRLMPLAKLLGISALLKKYPYEVSGGQKQRAAVARALRRAGFALHRRAAEPVGSGQRPGADHSYGYPQRESRQPRPPGAVHQGRQALPPAVPRRGRPGRLLSAHCRYAHPDRNRR